MAAVAHRHAAETWGEEAADTVLELRAPAGHRVATRTLVFWQLSALVVIAALAFGLAFGLR